MKQDDDKGIRREVEPVTIQHFAGNHSAPTTNSLKRDNEAQVRLRQVRQDAAYIEN